MILFSLQVAQEAFKTGRNQGPQVLVNNDRQFFHSVGDRDGPEKTSRAQQGDQGNHPLRDCAGTPAARQVH
jgi:hypothetical protein